MCVSVRERGENENSSGFMNVARIVVLSLIQIRIVNYVRT